MQIGHSSTYDSSACRTTTSLTCECTTIEQIHQSIVRMALLQTLNSAEYTLRNARLNCTHSVVIATRSCVVATGASAPAPRDWVLSVLLEQNDVAPCIVTYHRVCTMSCVRTRTVLAQHRDHEHHARGWSNLLTKKHSAFASQLGFRRALSRIARLSSDICMNFRLSSRAGDCHRFLCCFMPRKRAPRLHAPFTAHTQRASTKTCHVHLWELMSASTLRLHRTRHLLANTVRTASSHCSRPPRDRNGALGTLVPYMLFAIITHNMLFTFRMRCLCVLTVRCDCLRPCESDSPSGAAKFQNRPARVPSRADCLAQRIHIHQAANVGFPGHASCGSAAACKIAAECFLVSTFDNLRARVVLSALRCMAHCKPCRP